MSGPENVDFGDAPSTDVAIYDHIDQIFSDLAGKVLPTKPKSHIGGCFFSCGISVLSGVSYTPPEEIVKKVLKVRHSYDSKKIKEAFVVFSDKCRRDSEVSGGDILCKYIRDNKLGDILEMGPRMNPNSGNMIKIWVWAPPHESLYPRDRNMPVWGHNMKTDKYGNISYVQDSRFSANNFEESSRKA